MGVERVARGSAFEERPLPPTKTRTRIARGGQKRGRRLSEGKSMTEIKLLGLVRGKEVSAVGMEKILARGKKSRSAREGVQHGTLIRNEKEYHFPRKFH